MNVVVRDETGSHQGIADQITDTLTGALPLIEKVTHLPARAAAFRLVTPATWIAQTREDKARAIAREMLGSPPSQQDQQMAEVILNRWWVLTRWLWALHTGITLTAADGQPETLIAPKALRHTGVINTRTGLSRFVIHHAVRQAQIRASRGSVLPEPAGIRPAAWPDRAVDTLAEGHADWAELEVTQALFGASYLDKEKRRTSLSTPLRLAAVTARTAAKARWAHLRYGLPVPARASLRVHVNSLRLHQPVNPLNGAAANFVLQTNHRAVRDTWNRVWTDLFLVPTREEIAAPTVWRKRAGL
nr:hypothetical protein OH826_19380 [Streptomyces sp. NBC_00899]